MTTYTNVSEQWGDAVTVTVEDYRKQAAAFGVAVDSIDAREDGIYIDGERVAVSDAKTCMVSYREWRCLWEAARDRTETCDETISLTEAEWDSAIVDPDGAVATNRCIPQPYENCQEYRQHIIAGGRAVCVYWIFRPEEIDAADGDESKLDWSYSNHDRIETNGR